MSVLKGKVVPLGQSSGLEVRRVLPHRTKRSVGPFVFLDHFRPIPTPSLLSVLEEKENNNNNNNNTDNNNNNMDNQNGMSVGPHPHIGLATLTYLYSGAVLHRDSTGAERLVVPTEVNFMIAGRGVVHSERGKSDEIHTFLQQRKQYQSTTTTTATTTIPSWQQQSQHGLQFWMALSKEGEDVDPSFHHGSAIPLPQSSSSSTTSSTALLLVGSCNGVTQSSIPIDPGLGRVFCLDVHLPQSGDSFNVVHPGTTTASTTSSTPHMEKRSMEDPDESLEVGIYVVSGSVEFVPTDIAPPPSFRATATTASTTDPSKNQPVMVTTSGTMTVFKRTLSKNQKYDDNNDSDYNGTIGRIVARADDTRVILLGGTPLPERRYMLWNFVSSDPKKLDRAAMAWSQLDRTIFPPVIHEDNLDSIDMPSLPPTRSVRNNNNINNKK
jgi:redox-sensitive bicupin YhaK (pirin superfamily)